MCNITLPHDPYGPALAFIAKLLRKSPYEGRTRWREQSRKKPSRPARIAYGCHTGIFSIARARRELKQLCCYINPDFSVKKSDVNEHYEFDYPKIRKKNRTGKYLARGHGVRTERSEVRAPWTQSISTYSFFHLILPFFVPVASNIAWIALPAFARFSSRNENKNVSYAFETWTWPVLKKLKKAACK